ncbi:MAG: ABC transporter permease [Ilumatobacteraceae bacterium]|jgi:spermidine/putrescine transport system permease protein
MMRKRTKFGRIAINVVAGLGLLYLFAPIFFIIAFSFNKPNGNFNIAWQSFTFDNWLNPFAEKSLTSALWKSLEIAAISTLISTVLGSLIALALSRYAFKGSSSINLFLVLPLTTPEIVLGSSLATLFLGQNFIDFGMTTIIIAHIMFQVSFVALTVRARIRGFDWTLEQAAQDLGASPFRTFTKVTFPLILPGILAAGLLAFALSIDDFIITFFNSGSIQTFPLQIYGASRVRIPPQINVLASMILFLSVAILMTSTISGMRKSAEKQKNARKFNVLHRK